MNKMYKFSWKSKGRTLLWLEDKLHYSSVPKLIVFTYGEWKNNKEKILNKIKVKFIDNKIAVRSSSINEDSLYFSNAGAFESYLNIDFNDRKKIIDTVNAVFKSYGKLLSNSDELIIQKMVDQISVSGVIFTHEMKNRAPYYSINYDDISGSSTTVTSGSSRYSNKTLYIHRDSLDGVRSKRFSKLLPSIIELENIFNSDELDIEFIITDKFEIIILQVRPIVFKSYISSSEYKNVTQSISGLKNELSKYFFCEDVIKKDFPVFGQMPDWNPVEMIGVVPRNLAFSLYEKLITNDVWCKAREEMGYSKPLNNSLMHNFCGHPFINVKSSFSTFIPTKLDYKISEKLVRYWLEKLKNSPELHDKVEFDIAITIFSFDLYKRTKNLPKEIFSEKEKEKIKEVFTEHFKDLMIPKHPGSLYNAEKQIISLSKKLMEVKNTNKFNITELIDICKKYGTIPFAKLARHAFIGTTLMKSLNSEGVLTSLRLSEYFSSIKTILSEMLEDILRLKNKSIEIIDFNKKYGHLRPGTYDISSKSYREIDPIELFGDRSINSNNKIFIFNKRELNKINKLINDYRLPFADTSEFLRYVTNSIQARENSKFNFTKVIDLIFERVKEISKIYSVSIDDLSYLSIERLASIEKGDYKENKKEILSLIKINKKQYKINTSIKLPQLIMDANHAVVIPFQVSSPNFITNKIIEAEIKYIQSFEDKSILDNKIVLIESADPGYDWLFTTKFKGLLTKYGGANSHMAIRCAELNIPAAIGCGEELFEHMKKFKQLRLNCSSSLIQPI